VAHDLCYRYTIAAGINRRLRADKVFIKQQRKKKMDDLFAGMDEGQYISSRTINVERKQLLSSRVVKDRCVESNVIERAKEKERGKRGLKLTLEA
jgi:hypothetical protein